MTETIVAKKRGRKKNDAKVDENNISYSISSAGNDDTVPVEKIPKKRGRKPKGGKIINNPITDTAENVSITNVILHLKCSLDDLKYTTDSDTHIQCDPMEYIPNPPPDIMAYDPADNGLFSNFDKQTTDDRVDSIAYSGVSTVLQKDSDFVCSVCKSNNDTDDVNLDETDDNIDMKDVNSKLKQIKLQLYKNSNPEKKSACFWCTYDYDNPTCYIPKYELDGDLCGYGSFCRPECAVAYLLKENIDDSVKFERYHLLNKIYGKVYDFKRNIKPAPDPHYILDKFYGNLSIQEYRKLMKTEHMLLVIEKPMTRILPELHENTDDMDNIGVHGARGNATSRTGVYKVKRQSEKPIGPNKKEIMKENFGF
jgi:hypothetical protein